MPSLLKRPRLPLASLRLSLFLKITALIAVSAVAVVAANLAVVYRTTNELAVANLHQRAVVSTGALTQSAGGAVRFGDRDRVAGFGREAVALEEGDLQVVVLTGGDGGVLAVVGEASPALIEQLTRAALGANDLATTELGGSGFTIALPVMTGAENTRVGGVAALWTTDGAIARARADDALILGSGAGILVVLLLFAAWAVRQMVARPMNRLAASLHDLAQGRYETLIPETGRGDEIGDFARHVGDLRDRLRSAREEEQARERDREVQRDVVSALRDGLNALAQRDLTGTIETAFVETYEPLRQDYNESVAALRETILSVIDAATRMRQGTDDMAGSADNLSQRTETQAATLEETAAALQQISTRVSETASNARKAERIARGAQEQAQTSEPIVREAVEAMAAIQKRSSQIAQIITLIDDISFQTNLLALNAGVEAARAGDAGRGFAVVASEVRALAQRSSDAAREIKDLVSGSAEQVDHGVELVRRSGTALSQFAGQVDDIASLMSEVAQAADDQSHSVTEINVGVSQLDTVTQQNAAMVQQTTVAIYDLRQQSTELADLLQRFRLGAGATGAPDRLASAFENARRPSRRAVA
ncbi:MAG: methyl-accepting chemotaxis protein [Pararhodobacter sp.]